MPSSKTARRVYSAEELQRLRGTHSQPKLREAIEEHDGEDAEIVKGMLGISQITHTIHCHILPNQTPGLADPASRLDRCPLSDFTHIFSLLFFRLMLQHIHTHSQWRRWTESWSASPPITIPSAHQILGKMLTVTPQSTYSVRPSRSRRGRFVLVRPRQAFGSRPHVRTTRICPLATMHPTFSANSCHLQTHQPAVLSLARSHRTISYSARHRLPAASTALRQLPQ